MFSIFTKLRWFIRTYVKQYSFAIVLLLINYALILVPPWMLGVIADKIRLNQLGLRELYNYVISLFAVISSLYAINFIWQYVLFKGSDLIGRDSRRSLVSKLLLQSPIFYEKNTTGSLMGKATNDVRNLQDFGGYGMMALLEATAYPTAVVMIMGFRISWLLTFFSVLPLPLVMISSKKIGDKLYIIFDNVQKAFDKLNDSVLENVTGVKIIRAFVREQREVERFREKAEDLYSENMEQVKLISLFSPISRIVPGISFIIAFGLGGYLISKNTITLGNMVSFIVYLNMLTWPMFALGDYINVSEQASASMDRIQEVLDYPEDMVDSQSAVEYPGGGSIEFSDFDFKYPKSAGNALEGINLTVPFGHTLGVVGRIGSGKTTLLKQLLRYYPVEEKTLFFGGIPSEDIKVASLRERIGYVPQQHMLFSKTVEENILFGKGKSDNISLEEAILLADFEKDLPQLPDGLDSLVGEKGIALSGGQRQRISIARAMIKDPEILILDDSLSAVDAKTEEVIIRQIKEKRVGKTTLIAAHRLSGIAHADEIIVLEEGKIVQRGTHVELNSQEGWYKEQFLIQQLEGEEDGR